MIGHTVMIDEKVRRKRTAHCGVYPVAIYAVNILRTLFCEEVILYIAARALLKCLLLSYTEIRLSN